MHREISKTKAVAALPLLIIAALFAFAALVFMLLPDDMPYRWAAEGAVFLLVIYLFYLDMRYFVAQHEYTLEGNTLTVRRGKLGVLRDISLAVDLGCAVLLAQKGDPCLSPYSSAPSDNFCGTVPGWFTGGYLLVYTDVAIGKPRRLLFEPSPRLRELITLELAKNVPGPVSQGEKETRES